MTTEGTSRRDTIASLIASEVKLAVPVMSRRFSLSCANMVNTHAIRSALPVRRPNSKASVSASSARSGCSTRADPLTIA